MTTTVRACPACGGTMRFRLGEYQCDACPHRMADPAADEPAYGAVAMPPASQADPVFSPAARPAAIRQTLAPPAAGSGLRSVRDIREGTLNDESGYDPAPSLPREKLLLLSVYGGRVLLTLIAAAASEKGLGDGSLLLHDGISLGFIALALYTPLVPLKWIMAYLAAIAGAMLLLGFFFGSIAGMLFGPGGLFGFLGMFMSIVMTLLEMAFQFWLASTLFRDIHRLQAMRR